MNLADHVLECRPAEAGDIERIVALLADDVYGQARNPVYGDAKAAYDVAFAEMVGNADNTVIVARLGSRIVGCYQLTFIRGLSHRGARRRSWLCA